MVRVTAFNLSGEFVLGEVDPRLFGEILQRVVEDHFERGSRRRWNFMASRRHGTKRRPTVPTVTAKRGNRWKGREKGSKGHLWARGEFSVNYAYSEGAMLRIARRQLDKGLS